MKTLKELSKQEGVVLGTWLSLTDPSMVEFVKWSGFDFVCIDNEYFPFDMNMMAQMIRTANNLDIPSLVRISRMDDISMLISTGAYGIMIPDCNYERAKEAVDRIKYSPIGKRSMFGGTRAMRIAGMNFKEYHKKANDQVSLVVQIEGKEGMEDLDKILALEGVDFMCTGRNDISQSLGVPGEPFHPKVDEFEDAIIKRSQAAGKPIILGAFTVEEARGYIKKHGINMQIVSRDISFIMDGMTGFVKALK